MQRRHNTLTNRYDNCMRHKKNTATPSNGGDAARTTQSFCERFDVKTVDGKRRGQPQRLRARGFLELINRLEGGGIDKTHMEQELRLVKLLLSYILFLRIVQRFNFFCSIIIVFVLIDSFARFISVQNLNVIK